MIGIESHWICSAAMKYIQARLDRYTGDTLSNRLEEIVERITGGGSRTPVAMLHRRPY